MKTILIIEDEQTLLEVMRTKLERRGYRVIAALDGEDGMRLIQKEHPDLILLDILLPKKNGMTLLKELHASGDKTPVIIISNSGQPIEVDQALALGVRDYLVKANFTPEEVLEKVNGVLGDSAESTNGNGVPARSAPFSNAGHNPPVTMTAEISALAEDKNVKTSIVLIEDDQFLRNLISEKLVHEGFLVRSAIDGEEGLRLVAEGPTALILLDLILPGIDGFEVLKRIKQHREMANIPVMVLSNLGQHEDIERAKELGAVDFLIKANFTPGEVVEKIKKVLQMKYF